MKFGVREICDVTLRAKTGMTLGNTKFERDMPVLYFDSLKTSSLEGAATTVYAQGGKGNVRLIAWEGEKTLTFNMEDALISKQSLAVLAGADLIENETSEIPVHAVETTVLEAGNVIYLEYNPMSQDSTNMIFAYVIPLDQHGDIAGAPRRILLSGSTDGKAESNGFYKCTISASDGVNIDGKEFGIEENAPIMVDYYYKRAGVTEINITPEKFAGYFYLEGSTLFRNKSGEDLPAEFIIPNCKIQSNFTFSMAPTGDPSTFSFVLDAFPDYVKYDRTKKVLATMQIIEDDVTADEKLSGYNATGGDSGEWASGKRKYYGTTISGDSTTQSSDGTTTSTDSTTTNTDPTPTPIDPDASGASFRTNRILKSNN